MDWYSTGSYFKSVRDGSNEIIVKIMYVVGSRDRGRSKKR